MSCELPHGGDLDHCDCWEHDAPCCWCDYNGEEANICPVASEDQA
jgi:hypothetical protein